MGWCGTAVSVKGFDKTERSGGLLSTSLRDLFEGVMRVGEENGKMDLLKITCQDTIILLVERSR